MQRGRGGEGRCLVSLDSPGTWICVPDLGHTPVRKGKWRGGSEERKR